MILARWLARIVVILGISLPAASMGTPIAPSATGGRNAGPVAALAGEFDGTTIWTFGDGCPFVHQLFDATYTGGRGVGEVTLHIDVCVAAEPLAFPTTGTFTISTRIGTLTGTESGDFDFSVAHVFVLQTLTVTGGTRAFSQAAGTTLELGAFWPGAARTPDVREPITGTITVG